MLYFAPLNLLSNYVYRHLLLQHGVDYVFSELILVKDLDKALLNNKLDMIEEDIPRTIFQLGVSSIEEVETGVSFLQEKVPGVKEININMGCPQSSMQKTQVCGGLLHNQKLMGELVKKLSSYKTFIASAKIRLGTSPDNIIVKDYLKTLQQNGIRKVYIHARPLRYNYTKPCMHEHFKDLQKEFPNLQLIFNGDIDSPQVAKQFGDNVMIGRAALMNPFLFEDIKQQNPNYRDGPFNPPVKDPHLKRKESVKLTPEKIKIISEFLELAKEHNLRKVLLIKNLEYMLSGVTKHEDILKVIRPLDNTKEMMTTFNDWANKQQSS